jgi:hypothetical protein
MAKTPDISINTGPGAPNNFGGTCERFKPQAPEPAPIVTKYFT